VIRVFVSASSHFAGSAAAGVFWALGEGTALALAAGGGAFLGVATLGIAIMAVLS
jgi:hypothetical protein